MKFDRSLAAAVIILMAVFLPLHVAMHAAVHVGLQKPGGKPWVVEKGALTPHSDEDTSGVSVCLPDLALPAAVDFPASLSMAEPVFAVAGHRELAGSCKTIFVPPEG